MSSGRLFQATGPATRNARFLSCSLVLGTTKSPRAERWWNSRNLDAQFVEITWCRDVDCFDVNSIMMTTIIINTITLQYLTIPGLEGALAGPLCMLPPLPAVSQRGGA